MNFLRIGLFFFITRVTAEFLPSCPLYPNATDEIRKDLVLLHFADSYRFHLYGAAFAAGLRHLAHLALDENASVLVVHSGDIFFSCGLCNQGDGGHVPALFSYLNVSVVCPGNHEFDRGISVFENVARRMPNTFVLSNIYTTPYNISLENTHSYLIRTAGHWRVGFIGLWESTTLEHCEPESREELNIVGDPVAIARTLCMHLRQKEKVDLCICLTHMLETTDRILAQAGFCDFVLGGHNHQWIVDIPLRLIKTGTDLHDISALHILPQESYPFVWRYEHMGLQEMERLEPDKTFADLITRTMGRVDDTVLCQRSSDILLEHIYSRVRQTYLGQWVACLLRNISLAQGAAIASGFFRWDSQPLPATFTRAVLLEIFPFDDVPVCLQCTPRNLCTAFEQATLQNETGKFPQLCGFHLLVNPSANKLVALSLVMPHHTLFHLDCTDNITHIQVGSRTFDAIHKFLFPGCRLCEKQPAPIPVRDHMAQLFASGNGLCSDEDEWIVEPLLEFT